VSETSAKIEPFFNRGGVTLYMGDSLKVLKTLPDESVDSVVTDPPYGIRFMGQKWDISVPTVDVWAECLRVLKPGGHLLAFAGTRTQHRMAVGIEDAGFEIRDMIAWVYGSGFPKGLDVSKTIDKAAGAEREIIGRVSYGDGHIQNSSKSIGFGGCDSEVDKRLAIAPATDAAKRWQGWGTALKPAMEPITVARKPFPGTVADNVLSYGTSALNIDGCRVGVADWGSRPSRTPNAILGGGKGTNLTASQAPEGLGRWPANLIHDGDEEVLRLFPESSGGGDKRGNCEGRRPGGFANVGSDSGDRKPNATVYNDKGSAARFFYCAKASKKERGDGNKHPTVKPLDLMVYLCRLVTPPGGVVLDSYVGSGTTGKAAVSLGFRFIGIDDDPESCETAARRIGEEIDRMPLLVRDEDPEKSAS